jgi:hypothetical protein
MKKPFKVIQNDKERMEISYEDGKASIFLIKTEEGFIVDVFNKDNENLLTGCVWNDDLEPVKDWTDDLSEEEQPDSIK